MRTIVVKSTHPFIVSLLKGDTPEGVNVIGESPTTNRNIDFNTGVNVEVEVKLTIDLGVIAVGVFGAWLLRTLHQTKGCHYIGTERKRLPDDERSALQLIESEIQNDDYKS